MKKILSFYLIAAAATAAISCSSSTGTAPTTGQTGIIGNWRWIRTEGDRGFKPDTATPSHTQRYQFKADSSYVLTITPDGGKPAASGRFSMSHMYSNLVGDTTDMISFYTGASQPYPTPLALHGNDTIVIGTNNADGLQSTYVRE